MNAQANNSAKTLLGFLMATALSFTVVAPLHTATGQAQSSVTEEEAYAVGVQAHLYFYPLVSMDITRKQLSNVEPGKGLGGPMNTFVNVPAYPTGEMKAVVRPNF